MDRQAAALARIQNKRATSLYDKCVCFLLLIPFFNPDGLTYVTGIDWSYIWIVDFFILLLLASPSIRFMNKASFFYAFFFLSIFLSTVINGREISAPVILAGKMICLLIMVNYYAKNGKLRCLLQTIKAYLGVIIIITTLIQFLNQDIFGLSPSGNTINFLTSDNFLGYYYIPFMLTVYLSDIGKTKRYRAIDFCLWGAICVASLIRAWAATCLSIFVLYLVLLLLRKMKIFRLLNPLTTLLVNAGISILVIGFQIQNYFDWLIVDILHKDLTLSMRTYIWGSAIANFMKKPIFGYGTTSGGRLSIHSYSIGWRSYTFFSHNAFLEILVQGGVVAMVLFALIYIGANRSITSPNEHTELKTVINISVFSLLLMQFSEFAIYTPIANLPLILCFFYKDLLREGFGGALYFKQRATKEKQSY